MDSKKILLGFDGYIDRIMKPIRSRNGEETEYYQTLAEFTSYLSQKQGRSFSIETELIKEKIGGNMPNTALSLSNMGFSVVGIGAVGYPEIHPIFLPLTEKCRMINVGNPGICDALEFDDGKMMLSTNTEINEVDGSRILSIISKESLVHELESSDGVAFLNWGEMKGSSDIWKMLKDEILPSCTAGRKPLLVDFSCFESKSERELENMIEELEMFSRYFRVCCSLNQNELYTFAERFDLKGEINQIVLRLTEILPGENLVIHLLQETKFTDGGKIFSAVKEVCSNPKVITGGGDNFNAGLLAGLVLDMDIRDAVGLGNLAVNTFVETGSTVSMNELLKKYM